jgi:DNA-binding MarR family transcriptional regulator
MTRSATPAELGAHLGYWLRYVSNHVSHAFAQKLAGQGVTVAEWSLLRVLYDAGATPPSTLAATMGVTRGAVTKLADRLAAKGLVARTASPTDGRAQTLALTDAGRTLVPTLAALADRNEAEFFDHLPAADRALLERLLKDIVRRRGLTAMPLD